MKKYNFQQHIPDYNKKRLLHLLSSGTLIVNLFVFAILLPDVRAWTLGLAAVFAAYAIVFLFDNRKDEWAWWCIVFGIIVSVAISVCYILLFSLYPYLAIMGAEIMVSGIIFCVFKKK